jgi:hypothetical protein
MGVDGRMQGQKRNASRVLLVAFTIWTLAMIIGFVTLSEI